MSKSQEGRASVGGAKGAGSERRPRGRPRLEIDPDAVADAVAQLFTENGFDAVSISATAEKLAVSRATLYRTVPTKEHLLGILFERSTRQMEHEADEIISGEGSAAERLSRLIKMQVTSAVQMRQYLPVLFDESNLPPDVLRRWRVRRRHYERRWQDLVEDAMTEGVLDRTDPVLATRLIFGMCLWVSRWYRPKDQYTAEQIGDAAVRLIFREKDR